MTNRFAFARGLLALALAASLAGATFAQGVQSGLLSGTVTSTDGATLPGVVVTISSEALQGARTATTDQAGTYAFPGLPPGEYRIQFALAGFATIEQTVVVALAGTADVDATLSVAAVQETVEVTGVAASILNTPQVGANYRAETVDKLAMGRTLFAIAELAPGLSDNTPNVGQVTIAGAFAYDNVFLLNGVDINDNLFGNANNLFIEDAIEEVQVLTSGISAEYGRFSGGVINAVTKRGGNEFSGSFRVDFTNPAWQEENDFRKRRISEGRAEPYKSDLNQIYQATLGGPILKDKLWFFGAYRREKSTEANSLSVTGTPYELRVENPRYEFKLTGSPSANHTLSASYSRNNTKQFDRPSINATLSIDLATLVDRELPNDLFVANYTGVLNPNLFLEAQYSQKKFGFRGTGGTSLDIHDSPFLALGRAGIPGNSHYNAPYFDSNDPEDRNNRQYSAALTYFLSTGSLGRHDIKLGGEHYTSTRTGGNSQSSTSFRFLADPVVVGGLPQRDASGRIMPNWQPGATIADNWLAVRGAQIDLRTLSFYVNDRWQLNPRWTFNLGVRFERHTADTTQAGIVTPESSVLVPRLGATFDVKGDGQWILQATYAHYAGKASETQFADNTNVGTPNLVRYVYVGPAGQGVDFEPGFDLSNYVLAGGNFPVQNVFLDQGLKTPTTREWTLQFGTRLGGRGEAKAIYTNRHTADFLEDFITLDLGTTDVVYEGTNFGTFDNVFITNTDIPVREYQSLQFQANYRVTNAWNLFGHYTIELRNNGNFEGEAGNQPGNYSIIGDRPELYSEARHYPLGRLDNFQRHKVRVFTTYDLDFGRGGRATLGVVYRYNSSRTYSLDASIAAPTPEQRALDPGYARLPTTQTIYFGARGEGSFEGSHLFDVALNYELPVYKEFRLWLKGELRNVFNNQALIGFDNTIIPVLASQGGPVDALGLPTTYREGDNFGTAQADGDLPVPREYRFSVGFRF